MFNPFIMVCEIFVRAVVVECNFLKPCWYEGKLIRGVILLRISFSISLLRVDSKEMGRYDEGLFGSLLGLSLGIMMPFFPDGWNVVVHP